MAIFGFLIGSIIGLVGAILGLVFWEMTALQAMGFYLGSGFGVGMFLISTAYLRDWLASNARNQAYG